MAINWIFNGVDLAQGGSVINGATHLVFFNLSTEIYPIVWPLKYGYYWTVKSSL